jgi:hypothetical protein
MAKPIKNGHTREARRAQRQLEADRRKAGLPAKNPKPPSKLTPEQLQKRRERALAQWQDPNGKIRTRQREGAGMWEQRKPPKHAAALIREGVAEYGATVEAMCDVLQCSRDLFYHWLKRHDEIREAWEQGRAIMEEQLTSILYAQAKGGYAPAAMFLCKAKFGWRDNGPIPGATEDGPAEKAAKIRAALAAMDQADAMDGIDRTGGTQPNYD